MAYSLILFVHSTILLTWKLTWLQTPLVTCWRGTGNAAVLYSAREDLKHFLREHHFYFVRKETRPISILFLLMQLLGGGGCLRSISTWNKAGLQEASEYRSDLDPVKSKIVGMADGDGGVPVSSLITGTVLSSRLEHSTHPHSWLEPWVREWTASRYKSQEEGASTKEAI